MIFETGMVINNRYTILGRLGMGGMAVVYKARDEKLARMVTLKVMREEFNNDEEFIKRFQVEARAAAGLSNPNIVNVYDVGMDMGVNYIVMEFIDGVTLKDLIKRRAPFLTEEIAGVAVQIASALQEAHAHGVVHRDIKPQNIMVTTQNSSIKVTDFGIAKATGSGTLTTSSSTMGSVHYFSPEQARGGYVDNKSDIYSLGIVMYEMATGLLPFDGDNPVSVAMKQINEPLPDIRRINPNIPQRLARIIQKAAHKNTAMRYQSAVELIEDIRRMNDPEPPQKEETSKSKRNDNSDDKYEKQLEKRIVKAAIVTGCVIIFLISFVYAAVQIGKRPKDVTVPNFVNRTLEEIGPELEELKLTPLITEIEDDYVEKGKIVRQDEEEGVALKEGDAVHLYVSLGTSKIKVPDLKKQTINDAENLLKEASLLAEATQEFSDAIPINVIISQDPESDTFVEPYTVVKLVYSMGPEPKLITVPKVVGMTEAEAIEILQGLGLVVGRKESVNSNTTPEGSIISQSIKEGNEVEAGTQVTFAVSLGPAPEVISTPTPIPTPTPTVRKTTLVVSTPLPDDTVLPVRLRVLKVVDSGSEAEVVFENTVYELPLAINVSGTGFVDYYVYLLNDDGTTELLALQQVDFDEE
ncbi:MAG: PASTA domain-containing protein [Clostridiales bacterium]|jgi:serine/threonine-protein kinase|nr:PASTA domain-containing protein [Clostridiales bacterium]